MSCSRIPQRINKNEPVKSKFDQNRYSEPDPRKEYHKKEETVKEHNLNIHLYSFNELLDLFDLTDKISSNDIKRAKKQVLMLHPDKSRLPADYFLFYKKAFDMIVAHYETTNKQNVELNEENTEYKMMNTTDFNKSTSSKIQSAVNEMKPDEFNKKFNQLFDTNMVQPKNDRNDWFAKEEPVYETDRVANVGNIGMAFETIKQKNQGMVVFKDVCEMGSSSFNSSNANNLYGDNDDEYVSSNPFSKLKFEDLRKVHKDQSIFAVGESDFKKVAQYSSVEHYVNERAKTSLEPNAKGVSEQYLSEKERVFREHINKKQHEANLTTQINEGKNKNFMASFLQLQ
jgi:hypothetical protein